MLLLLAFFASSANALILPPGTTVITEPIVVPPNSAGYRIQGHPRGSIIKASPAFKEPAMFIARNANNVHLSGFTIDGNRQAFPQPVEIPPYDESFASFYKRNGILVIDCVNVSISRVHIREVADIPILISASKNVAIDRISVTNSGSKDRRGRNNTTGGVLFEDGTTTFSITRSRFQNIRGNAIWTHSRYTSPRNKNGQISHNRFGQIGRDAIQIGHATGITVEWNRGTRIGYPASLVDTEHGGTPVAIDTAGNVDHSRYANNTFSEINGKCIDLDGFHDGEVSSNTCVNRQPPTAYPAGHYGIVMNNTNPDMHSRNIRITGNTLNGTKFGGIFIIGQGHVISGNRLTRINLARCNESHTKFGCIFTFADPDMLQTAIYLGRGAERPDPSSSVIISGNTIEGHKMRTRCIGIAPGLDTQAFTIENNTCRKHSDSLDEVSARMQREWNQRAREDANFYVAFGRRDQDSEEFFETAREIFVSLETELKRLDPSLDPHSRRALEIGCGPGRLLKPMSAHFGEIHGVDVADEMIRRAQANLGNIPHAHVHHTSGANLNLFPADHFDFVYSYAVFQHIPSRAVVLSYLQEASRVLKPTGIIRVQLNGLDQTTEPSDTWSGVRFSADDIRAFARDSSLELLALEGARTQYMWASLRKPARPVIRRVTNTHSSEPFAPSSGRFASLSFWIENLPQGADLNSLSVRIADTPATLTYIGPKERDGMQQVNLILPALNETGLVPVTLDFNKVPLCPPFHARIVPPGPAVPVVVSVTDGIDMLSGTRIVSGTIKVTLEEVYHLDQFEAHLGTEKITAMEFFCVDPGPPKYEINLQVPGHLRPGFHLLQMGVGRRKFSPIKLDVVTASTLLIDSPVDTPQ